MKTKLSGLPTSYRGLVRILRLLMGIVVLVYAVSSHDMVLGIAGSLLVSMAVFNVGCCAMGGCNVSASKREKKTVDKQMENVRYEEVM